MGSGVVENGEAQTVATFTGTLLKRKRMPGKPFVQLIFRETEKDWLCLSSNLKHVASLQVGKTYQIEGIFKSIGEHQYIHEPIITPIAREIQKRRVLISLGLGLGILLLAGGIVLAATHDPSAPRPPAAKSPSNSTRQSPVTEDTPPPTADTSTDAPTSVTPPPAPTPAPAPKPKITPSVTPPPVAPPPATAPPAASTPPPPPAVPAPDCDTQVTPFQTLTIYDATKPNGTIVTPGTNGEQTTCYPNGRDQPGETTTIPPVDRVVTTTTPPDDTGQ